MVNHHLLSAALTHPGQEREDNEDAFGLYPGQGLFVVADGMGGRSGGPVAAHIAVETVHEFLQQRLANARAPWPHPINRQVSLGANILNVGLKVANTAIRRAAAQSPEQRRMGCTTAALLIGETHLAAAHVGDVRIYRLRGGQLSRLTRDHSLVEEMQAAQPAGAELAANLNRNVVTRALGTREDVDPTVYVNTFAAGDTYLLCSDGLWGEVPDSTIGEVLTAASDLEQACQQLVDAANAAGGRDNITALLVRIP